MRFLPILATVATLSCSGSRPAPSSITRPRIVAHRGASVDAPENTLAAFRRAFALGAEAIELDVRLSKDGEVVVIHDDTTRRTAGVDRAVADQTLAELRSLDAGSWRGQAFAGERIPTLAEVLAVVPRGGTVFVELKSGPETAAAVATVIKTANIEQRGAHVALQAYDAAALSALAGALPGAPAYWTVDPPTTDGRQLPYEPAVIDEAVQRKFTGLALDVRGVTDDFLAAAKRAGLAMDVWTLNDAALLRTWLGKDVRWIETDRPDLAPTK